MTYISASFTQHHHSDFYLEKGQGHRLLNLQDLVDLSSLKKSFCYVNLHCSIVLSSQILHLSFPNVKISAGYRAVPQIKVNGINIFRDFSSKIIKMIELIIVIFRDTCPLFCLNACELNTAVTCQGVIVDLTSVSN